ncbi:type IV pilus assembly protein FimV [Derxia gummosa]|uniref:Type IV pilus assembly protein FimV n=1 Tax=Derxia gummosa DSM 723 TaxID=1121388 RepID=A0A8B6XAS4_9BURK|nr:hypothetical protein [Derxia gummosa]
MSAKPAQPFHRSLRGVSLAFGLAFALVGRPAGALGLGEIEMRSQLGQAFHAEIPVRLAEGETLTSACVNLPRVADGDIPGIGRANVTIESRGGRTLLVVRGRSALNEPVARLVIEAGCDARVTRDFTLFVDPPELGMPANQPVPAFASVPLAVAGAGSLPAATRAEASASTGQSVRKPRVVRPRPAPAVPGANESVPAHAPALPPGDRMRLLSPEDSRPIGGAQAPSDRAGIDGASIAAEARISAREQELAAQVIALGKEIEELKKRAATEVAHPVAAAEVELPPWWAFALGGATLLSMLAALGMYRRQRQLGEMIERAPWWQNAAAPVAPAPMVADMPATLMSAYATEADDDLNVRPVARASLSSAPVEVNFPDRLGEIEVEELSGTRALNALRTEPEVPQRAGVVTRSTVLDMPDAEFELSATQEQPALQASSVFDAAKLPPLDFDLGMPEGEQPASAGLDFSATVPELRPATGVARTPLGTAEARRIQARLRATVDAVEQADNYVENGQFESAVVTLARYIEEHADAPRAAWLMLLELYRRTDRTPAYEKLAAAFAERFGRPARAWDQAGSLDRGVGLDSNPEMLQSIWAKWGTPEAIGLLAELLEDPDASEADYYNLALQRDLLNFVKICPLDG